ncbi:MAG: hypothetical protein GY716_08080 [bacterium]|nr:hypothetical protein [bacterium]
MLARLASDTGGRFTRYTNDLSLALARAQRDLGCRYAVGFYDRSGLDDTPRHVSLKVRRPGLRVVHPSSYLFRSPSAKRESMIRTAFLAPEMFQNGIVRSHVFPLHPKSPKSWETLLAVSFPVEFAEGEADEAIRDFGAVVTHGNLVQHKFNRRVSLAPGAKRAGGRRFTFLEPITLAPGKYSISVVVSDPEGTDPSSIELEVRIPEVPRRELMLVDSILGRPAGDNIVVKSSGDAAHDSSAPWLSDLIGAREAFEPLLVQQTERPDTLYARNKACLVRSNNAPDRTVKRAIRAGDEPDYLAPVALVLDDEGNKTRCQTVFDTVEENSLEPGSYVFETAIEELYKEGAREEVRFAVSESESDADESPEE